MKQRDIEQAVSTTQTAEAEKITGVADDAVSLGKFKDVKSLLTAYENLESEFTRRSRRLKELEGIVSERKGETTPTGASPKTVATDGGTAKNPIVAEATAAKAISENENILIALPFYIENIPGILLEFLSDITPKSRAARGKLDAKPYEYK